MEEVFKISKDVRRANDLLEMAKERLNEILPALPKDKEYKIIEEYYEIIVQLITRVMHSDGYKTLSHVSLIEYLKKNYEEFEYAEIEIIDALRKFRHGAVYYGKKVKSEFLVNNEDRVKNIIQKLFSIVEKKIGEEGE
jgi:hypothetical protein